MSMVDTFSILDSDSNGFNSNFYKIKAINRRMFFGGFKPFLGPGITETPAAFLIISREIINSNLFKHRAWIQDNYYSAC
jgi:hypothetical protein